MEDVRPFYHPSQLEDGRTVPELAQPVAMTIASKCPNKWLFVDLETGDIWLWKRLGGFTAVSDKYSVTMKVPS